MTATKADAYLYHKQWRIERAKGHRRVVPAEPTVTHVKALRAKGWSLRGIGEASGAPVQTISRALLGHQLNVHRDTEKAILALRPDDIFTRPNRAGFVPNIGARRRLQALMAIGWRHSDLTPLTGFRTAVMNHQVGDWISQEKHDAMKRVYEQLWNTRGPATSLARAAKAGYLPPMAWDDDTIDDPNYTPEPEAATEDKRIVKRKAFIENIEFLLQIGENRDGIAAALDASWEAVERRLDRYDRRDLIPAHDREAIPA